MKISNLKIYITEIGLIASALCTGCTLSTSSTNSNQIETIKDVSTTETTSTFSESNSDYSSITNSETDNTEDSINVDELSENEKSYLQKKSTINISFAKTLDIINNTDINCKYNNLFEIDKALHMYNSSKIENINNVGSIINNKKVNKEKLKESIIRNSNSNIDGEILNKCVDILKNNIDYFLQDSNININRLEKKLELLKIEDNTDFAYAYYSPSKNTLAINPRSLKTISNQENLSLDETYERIVGHETNHLLQAITEKEIKDNNYTEWFGPCIKSPNLKVNSLYWEWYIESSAEQMIVEKGKYDSPLLYQFEINALDGLKIATLFNDKKTTDLERISLSSDINELYKYFNCNTEYEKKELLELFYKLNLICQDSFTSSSADFYNYYEAKNGYRLLGEEKEKFLYNVCTSVAMDEAKLFYKNLINNISNKECKLEDILHLISIEEDELAIILKTNVKEYEDDYTKFLEAYMNIQKSFFEELSIYYGKTSEEIQEIYDKYHISSHQNIELLKEENSNYYKKMEENRSTRKYYSINVLQKYNIQKNVKLK